MNDEDEIRSIANPDQYFNFFLNRNPRVNLRQRFQFDTAVQSIVLERLESLALHKIPLPPVEPGSGSRHVNLFISRDLGNAERIIVVFGERAKDFGMVAGRIADGPGGIEKGSMVGAVKAIQRRDSTAIILANMSESYWSTEHKRAVTAEKSRALSMPSLVHLGIKYHPQLNSIPGSEDALCHARTVLNTVISQHANKDAKINIIAIGDNCGVITSLLDEEDTWKTWGASLQGVLFYNPAFYYEQKQGGLKDFLAKKSRGYAVSEHPLGTPLSGPDGNPDEGIPRLGFPCYSAGEAHIGELCFVSALEHGLSYLDEVARTPDFENPTIAIVERAAATVEETEGEWDALSPDQKPSVATMDEDELQKQVKILRRWRHFEKTGHVPTSDDESDMDDEREGDSLPVKPWDEAP